MTTMLALILDRTHACLVDQGRVPDVELAGGRPLPAVEARLAVLGVTLPAPAGSRARGDGRGRDFVFVTERFAAPAGMDWRPLREADDEVTDGFGYPRLVLRTAAVREQPFGQIDAETAAAEGEGDLSHEDWREAHEAYFVDEAGRLGLSFDERALISVERFEVVHVVGRADRVRRAADPRLRPPPRPRAP